MILYLKSNTIFWVFFNTQPWKCHTVFVQVNSLSDRGRGVTTKKESLGIMVKFL